MPNIRIEERLVLLISPLLYLNLKIIFGVAHTFNSVALLPDGCTSRNIEAIDYSSRGNPIKWAFVVATETELELNDMFITGQKWGDSLWMN